MVVLSLVWSMKLNKLSLSARARKQRDGEMASPWRPWEWGIASEVEGQTFFCICNMIIMKKTSQTWSSCSKTSSWVRSDMKIACI